MSDWSKFLGPHGGRGSSSWCEVSGKASQREWGVSPWADKRTNIWVVCGSPSLCCYPGIILILHLCSQRFSLDNKLYDHTALGAYRRWWQEERRKEFQINQTVGQKASSNKIPWYVWGRTFDKIFSCMLKRRHFPPFLWLFELKVCSITVLNLIFAYLTYFSF